VLRSGGPARKTDAVNNQSIVALFARDGRAALLTGDAGAPAEAELLAAGALKAWDSPVVSIGPLGRILIFDAGGIVATAGLTLAFVVSAARNTRALYAAEPLPARQPSRAA
jgi:hypothetical protein